MELSEGPTAGTVGYLDSLGKTEAIAIDRHVGVDHALERLFAQIEELGIIVPALEGRVMPVLTDGGVLATGRGEGPQAPRSPLAGRIDNAADRLREVIVHLQSIHERVDL